MCSPYDVVSAPIDHTDTHDIEQEWYAEWEGREAGGKRRGKQSKSNQKKDVGEQVCGMSTAVSTFLINIHALEGRRPPSPIVSHKLLQGCGAPFRVQAQRN
jgi:hypothetical protein